MAWRSKETRKAASELNKAGKRPFVAWARSTRMRPADLAKVLGISKSVLANRLHGWGPGPERELFAQWVSQYTKFVDKQLSELPRTRERLTNSDDQCPMFAAWLDSTGLTRIDFAQVTRGSSSTINYRYLGYSRFRRPELDEWLSDYETFLLERRDDAEAVVAKLFPPLTP